MGRKPTGPQNIVLRRLIRQLENTKINIYKDIATLLRRARRLRIEANLGHINRVVNDGDVIAIPGKLLGSGDLQHKCTIGALAWSESVEAKIKAAGAKIMSLPQLLEAYPTGSNVRLMR